LQPFQILRPAPKLETRFLYGKSVIPANGDNKTGGDIACFPIINELMTN